LDRELTEGNYEKVRTLSIIANDIGITMAQLALAWILYHPEITSVITGASRPQQVIDNVAASGIKLTDDVYAEIEAILA